MSRKLTITLFLVLLPATVFSQTQRGDPTKVLNDFLEAAQKNRFEDAKKQLHSLILGKDDFVRTREDIKFIADNNLKVKKVVSQSFAGDSTFFHLNFQRADGEAFSFQFVISKINGEWKILTIYLEKKLPKTIITIPRNPQKALPNIPGLPTDIPSEIQCPNCI